MKPLRVFLAEALRHLGRGPEDILEQPRALLSASHNMAESRNIDKDTDISTKDIDKYRCMALFRNMP